MIPYNVTVLAINAAGRGTSTTNVIFTEEGGIILRIKNY